MLLEECDSLSCIEFKFDDFYSSLLDRLAWLLDEGNSLLGFFTDESCMLVSDLLL